MNRSDGVLKLSLSTNSVDLSLRIYLTFRVNLTNTSDTSETSFNHTWKTFVFFVERILYKFLTQFPQSKPANLGTFLVISIEAYCNTRF